MENQSENRDPGGKRPPNNSSGPGGMPMGGGPPGRMPMEKVKLKNSKETILRLWGYLGKRNFMLIAALILVFISSAFTILASYMIRPIINGLTEYAGTSTLITNLLIMLGIYLVAVISSYLQTRLMLEVAQNALEKIRYDLFDKMQKLPLKFFDSKHNGDLMSRFTNDIDAMSQMLSTTLAQLISGVTTLVATIAIMIYTNWFLTIIMLTISPLFNMFTRAVSKRSMNYYKGQQKAIGDLNGFIEERITGQKVIKVFNHEQQTIEQFNELNQNYREQSFKAQFISGTMGPIMGSLTQLSYTIVACIGGLLCVFRGFDIGGFTIFLNYSRSFSRPINDIFMQINTLFAALAGAERVFEVIDYPAEIADATDCVNVENIVGEVILKDVKFGYNPAIPVLKNISVTAKPSQKIAFVGSTGAGKTTITNLLNRFYDIQSGEILIDGVPITKYKKAFLRENIAMVLQDTHLFEGSIMENIRYGRLDAADSEVIAAAQTANAHEFIKKLEYGYDTILTNDGANLSQGQRQLLNIARAVISKAPILVLDEATSSVDTRTERHIELALDRLMQSRTTFIIAHRLSTVRNSDMIVVLERGEIIESGNHQQLLEQKGKYHSLYTGASKLD
ncbi:MAG: multidrug ABC transporter ATP-binding protein [Epulopiscium sp. Nuni2H_MBin001]|nr:MAG: multidrug ABC transporter ATP-binding protein [Epulopiscium sp. Nuni2H_MBin001]